MNNLLKIFTFIFILIVTSAFSIENHHSGLSMQKENHFIIPEYQFINGQKLKNLKIHYATLGIPQTNLS